MSPVELDVRTDLSTEPWADLDARQVVRGAVLRVGVNPAGTEAGEPTLVVLVETDDGGCVLAETTLTLARIAAVAVAGAWPE